MDEHSQAHHHEEDESVCVTVGIIFIAVIAALFFIALI